jgi:catechol 2,3-dioxygenase-like lactoylglutathione lyase family enzyme
MLIAVKDIEKSKKFYYDVFGLEVINDFGANVTLKGGISLQTIDTWKSFINKKENEVAFKNNACELYFEADNIDEFVKKLNGMNDIEYIHPLFEHSWGQRVVRFYDLDGHIIEVGENLKSVVKKFIDSGLSIRQTAVKMDVAEEYIKSLIKEDIKL